jgi:hypothetical protein
MFRPAFAKIALAAAVTVLLANCSNGANSTQAHDLNQSPAICQELKVAPGCTKIEGSEIGQAGIELTANGVTVTITEWQSKGGSSGEFIGFKFTTSGGSAKYAVKAGTKTFAGTSGTWTHPAGTSGSEASAISNITFCGNPSSDAGTPTEDAGTPTTSDGGTGEEPPTECGPDGAPGSPCTVSAECTSGICTAGICEGNAPPGAPCTQNIECATDRCSNSVCEGQGGGTPCTDSAQCTSGKCTSGMCEGPGGIGDPCASTTDCGPLLICNNGLCQININ